MAISVVQTKTATGTGSSISATLTSTGTGNCLVVLVMNIGGAGAATLTGVTIGGSASNFSQLKTASNGGTQVWIWACPNAPSGQTALSVSGTSFGSGGGSAGLTCYEVSGLASSSVLDKSSSGTGTSTSWSSGTTATTTQGSEFIAGCVAQLSSITGPASPWSNSAPGSGMLAGQQISSTTGTFTYNGTASSSFAWAAAVVTLLPPTTATHSGTADLSGTGTLTATGAFAGTAALSGAGTLSWSGSRILKATVLAGTGTLSGTRIGILAESATLAGTGTLTAAQGVTRPRAAALSGSGALTIPGVRLGFSLALSGTGTLTIIGTGGTVQAAAGIPAPYAWPGSSQVAVAPPGTTS